jgi:hypothetical protein
MTKILIMKDDQVIELLGDELKLFEAQRAKDFAESEADKNSKLNAKTSALAKLAALGLTPEEISAIS